VLVELLFHLVLLLQLLAKGALGSLVGALDNSALLALRGEDLFHLLLDLQLLLLQLLVLQILGR